MLHGALAPTADVSHWSSLRGLRELKLLPAQEGGCRDAQLGQLASLASSVTSLALRLHQDGGEAAAAAATPGSLWRLAAALPQLQQLSVAPLPAGCQAAELQPLLDLPSLTSLQLGTSDAAQVWAVAA